MDRRLISEDTINRIRSRYDLVRVVAEYAGPLVLAGSNFQCRCPFRPEQSPSFTVSPRYQVYYCFGCETGGNVFTFMTRITGTSFPETIRELGRKVGINVSQ